MQLTEFEGVDDVYSQMLAIFFGARGCFEPMNQRGCGDHGILPQGVGLPNQVTPPFPKAGRIQRHKSE